MIASVVGSALHAAAAAATLAAAPLAPAQVLAHYHTALAALHEPATFTVDYTLEQTGTRSLEQEHRVFRHGTDERDETLAVNGTKTTDPSVRIFRGRAYRYTVARLAPQPASYDFAFAGMRRIGRHTGYVFRLTPKGSGGAFRLTDITIDGLTFLPSRIGFRTASNDGRGAVIFAKSGPFWVADSATASARVAGGVAHERLTFSNWRFPASLPASTFASARPLATVAPPG